MTESTIYNRLGLAATYNHGEENGDLVKTVHNVKMVKNVKIFKMLKWFKKGKSFFKFQNAQN